MRAKKSKNVYKSERKEKTQVVDRKSFAPLVLGEGSSPLTETASSRSLEAFNPQWLSVKTQSVRGLDLGRLKAMSSECTSCSSPSSGDSDPADLLWVKVALGKSIRDLAEANYQLSSALTEAEQSEGNRNNVGELVRKVEQLLASQNDYLHEIGKT